MHKTYVLSLNVQRTPETKLNFQEYLDALGTNAVLLTSDNGNTRVLSAIQAAQSLVAGVRTKHNNEVKEKNEGKIYSHTDACIAIVQTENPFPITVEQLRRVGSQVAKAARYPGYMSEDDCEVALKWALNLWIAQNPLAQAQLEAEAVEAEANAKKKADKAEAKSV